MKNFRLTLNVTASLALLVFSAESALGKDAYCKGKKCNTHTRGRMLDNAATIQKVVGVNTEQEREVDRPLKGYAISVDGEVVSGSEKFADQQREADVALDKVDIQVKYDGLDVKPVLNVSTVPVRRAYVAGEEVDFLVSLNYGAWVSRGEVRIFEVGALDDGKAIAAIPVSDGGAAIWHMPSTGAANFAYVLRVYDANGNFDETRPLSLVRSSQAIPQHEVQGEAVAPGFGEDATAIRNIPVYGGAVTVFGSRVPTDNSVVIMGERVPVDAEGKFVVQRILPPGDHDVSVKVGDAQAKGLEFTRDINIPSSEWFYVGLADLTVGKHLAMNPASAGEFDDVYSKGRLAFYLKGKIKGRVLLTAAGDTGEDKLQNLFKGLDAKDPKQFLRRIDPDKYYPVYGDDSTTVEDAPTRGKFYVRLERGDSHVMWGNFKTRVTGTKFLRNERALYGANAVYRSEDSVPTGERKTEGTAYAAQPGTLPQRDILRGTGGSAYFLRHQDLTIGSETVTVTVSDPITNLVIERRHLKYGTDYELDYTQGLILLRQPLQSTVADTGSVRTGALGGNPVNLVVSYEFTPSAGQVDGYILGGRGQQWLGDHLRVGVTASREKTGIDSQTLMGADLRLQKSEATYMEAEVGQTQGPGFGNSISADGGATITTIAGAGASSKRALGYRLEGHADVAELTNGALKGDLEARYENKQGGFSTLDEQVVNAKQDFSFRANVEIADDAKLKINYGNSNIQGLSFEQSLEVGGEFKATDALTVTPGVQLSQKKGLLADYGERADLGVKLNYKSNDDHSGYVFGQATVGKSGNRKRNDRVGLGGEKLLSEKVKATGEVSYGTGGFGGLAQLTYNPTADDTYYAGYRLDPDRSTLLAAPYAQNGGDLGSVIAGAKHRYSERLAIFAEDSYDLFGLRKTLAQTYGVNYTPDARWNIAGNLELGTITDNSINPATLVKNSDFDRKALAVSADFKGDTGNAGRAKAEVRFENSDDHTRDLTSYLFASSISLRANEDWRFLGSIDAVFADATQSMRNGQYLEGTLGYAYRPVDNDRWDTLIKYNFLYDLPGIDQVTAVGSTNGPSQRSHIFSIDSNYDISKIVTIGAKYAFRIGETRPRDGSSGWVQSDAHLGVLRADLNIVHDWDALAEARLLWSPKQSTADLGLLVAAYRHFGENFKLGIGYNFGRFTDDLRDQTYDHSGVFINAVGQF
jgi:hypothetical protein